MEISEKIIFIINPIAGTRSKQNIPALIDKYLNKSRFGDCRLVYSEYGGHAKELAQEAISAGYRYIIAVGGDGTMNEVAGAIVNSASVLGILPLGSGNGLARHLKIPLNLPKAIQLINQKSFNLIDSCKVNNRYFFCTAGVGFDAHIGNVFATLPDRGFKSYVKATLSHFFSYKPSTYQLSIDGKSINRTAFLVTFANAAQYGNNAYIAPTADIKDGLIEVCILHPFPKRLAVSVGLRLFQHSLDSSRYMETYKAHKVLIQKRESEILHVDGEPLSMPGDLEINILPQSIKVLSGKF